MTAYNPNALTDDDIMDWSKHSGKRLGEVPDGFWRWFLAQDWCDERPNYVEYANPID